MMRIILAKVHAAFHRDFPLGDIGDTQIRIHRKRWLALLGICVATFAIVLFSSVYVLANEPAFGQSSLGVLTSGILLLIGGVALAIATLALSWLFLPKHRSDVSRSLSQ